MGSLNNKSHLLREETRDCNVICCFEGQKTAFSNSFNQFHNLKNMKLLSVNFNPNEISNDFLISLMGILTYQ